MQAPRDCAQLWGREGGLGGPCRPDFKKVREREVSEQLFPMDGKKRASPPTP